MCIDCDTAKVRMWHAFTASCKGCQARALSRGPLYHESHKQGLQTQLYRKQLERLGLTHAQVKAAHDADAMNSRPKSMAQMVADGYKPGCTGKQSFTHWADAEKRAKLMRANNGSTCKVEPYSCKACGKIHIGQSRERKKHKEMA